MSLKKSLRSLAIIILASFCVGIYLQKDVQASNKYEVNHASDVTFKKNGISFTTKLNDTSNYTYDLIMKKKNKKTIITKKSNCTFLTNGKILYYVTQDQELSDYQYKNTIYKYNIATGKRTKIISGTDYTVEGCKGKYLYCGRDEGADGVVLYALNLKTGKKKYMRSGVGYIITSGQYVVTSTNAGDAGNYPIYVFKANGNGKKKVANGGPLEVKKNKLYYSRYNVYTNKVRIYKCSLNGKNKKPVTGWLTQLPKKYIK